MYDAKCASKIGAIVTTIDKFARTNCNIAKKWHKAPNHRKRSDQFESTINITETRTTATAAAAAPTSI